MARGSTRKREYQRIRADSGQHRRILVLMLLLGLGAFLPTVVRLYGLMVVDYEYYAGLALSNQSRSTPVTAPRGRIYDRNMNILATSESVEHIYLNPRELKQAGVDVQELAQNLGRLLEKDPQDIEKKAKDTGYRYQLVKGSVSREQADEVRDYINTDKIAGVHLEPGFQRSYPFGSLAAQVIGFTNASGVGSEGIEASYQSYLSGSAGKVVTTKGNNEMDMPFSYENFVNTTPGCDVVLTLDTTVQTCLEEELQKAVERYDVQNGAFGLVLNVNTGEVLAMATLGSYDPNAYLEIADPRVLAELEEIEGTQDYAQALTDARLKQWRNRCISDGYEPGSTFKVLTMAAALDSGAIDLNTSFYCRGSEQIPGRAQLLHCWRSTGHGAQKTPEAIANSCNVAFAHIALKMGGDTFYDYISRFGILEKTGLDLSGESKGIFFDKALVTDTQKWGTASLTSGSFGQTFKITPLQLVTAISSVVNGGNLMEPYLVSQITDAQGNTLLRQEPTLRRRVISEETSRVMCRLLEGVVTEGTAKNAAVSGFSIGGKTGTSEKIDVFDENGQRVLDKIVSFVGIASMDDPEYIVLVALDTPSRQTGIYISGGVMAAPTVGAVMERILPYLGIAPSTSGEVGSVADYTGMTRQEVQTALKKQGISYLALGEAEAVTGQLPAPGQSLGADTQILLYFGTPTPEEQVTVPDFTAMNRQQAGDAALGGGLTLRIAGNQELLPWVTVAEQSIPPGTTVPPGTRITLKFIDTKAAG